MNQLYYEKTDVKTISYAAVRVILGGYLLIHSIINVLNYNQFISDTMKYFEKDSSFNFLAELAPLVPLMEFFIAGMIILGLYTSVSLKWAVGLGIFFTIFFHVTGDYETALVHCYTLLAKTSLYLLIAYNKLSLDYYNIWKEQESISKVR
ncbi:MAG: hypothetical protein NWQ09_04310 [Nonlabens sp.]|nr:hypothetical protein [Nonlabens sp.]